MTISERFEQLLQRMKRSELAARSELIGCSKQEIAALEARYGLRLPESYALYLRTMGHKSGRLFTHDHMAVFYPYVLKMTAEQRQAWSGASADNGSGPPADFQLPEDALLILGRLGDQFEFIRCNNRSDESPVWYFNTFDWVIKQSHASVLDWLETWCGEAEEAIADGFYDEYPDGTTP